MLGECFGPWFLFLLWIFGEHGDCVLPLFVVVLLSWCVYRECLHVLDAGILGEGILTKTVFVISLG